MLAKFLGAWGEGTPTTTPPPSNTGGIPHLDPIARRDRSHVNGSHPNRQHLNQTGRDATQPSVSRETMLRPERFRYKPYAQKKSGDESPPCVSRETIRVELS